ncbi:MAG: hypothetical protein RLZZ71_2370, partial [Bacteroidota bacterium]
PPPPPPPSVRQIQFTSIVIEENVETPPPSQDKLKDEKIADETTEGEDGPMGPSDAIAVYTPVDDKKDKAEPVLTFVQEMPAYPGGEKALYEFLYNNITYPEQEKSQNIEGTVFVNFVVEKDGTPSNFTVTRGVEGGKGLDREALAACKKLGKFNPGKQNGVSQRVFLTIPIKFTLADN